MAHKTFGDQNPLPSDVGNCHSALSAKLTHSLPNRVPISRKILRPLPICLRNTQAHIMPMITTTPAASADKAQDFLNLIAVCRGEALHDSTQDLSDDFDGAGGNIDMQSERPSMWKTCLDDAGDRLEEDLGERNVVSGHTGHEVVVLRKVLCQVLECILCGLQLACSCSVMVSHVVKKSCRFYVLVLGAESFLILFALVVTVTATSILMLPVSSSPTSSTSPSLRFLVGRALPDPITLPADGIGVDAIDASASLMSCN